MLQDSYENLKGLIIVPGAEYSLHKKKNCFYSQKYQHWASTTEKSLDPGQ